MVLVALALLSLLAGCTRPASVTDQDSGPGPDTAVAAFVAAWQGRDVPAAAKLTSDPAAAEQLLDTINADLKPTALSISTGPVDRTAAGTATVTATLAWTLKDVGTWKYTAPWTWKRTGSTPSVRWDLVWSPAVIHPDLGPQQALVVRTTPGTPGTMVDRNNQQITAPVRVYSVVALPGKIPDVAAMAAALAAVVAPFDATITAESIVAGVKAADPNTGYTVINLRDDDYNSVRTALDAIVGLSFPSQLRDLPPTADFAKVLMTQLTPVVNTMIQGSTGWRIATIDASGDELDTLAEKPPLPGPKVTLSLDSAIQEDADSVLTAIPEPAVLVVIQPSTGGILAVAQNAPANALGPIALTGQYPPGSIFKIVTGTAAIDANLVTPTTEVDCPGQWIVNSRPIRNEGFDLGTVTVTEAFAHSCNTTFAKLGSELPDSALPATAKQYGIGLDFDIKGVTTLTGKIRDAATVEQRAENGFGQGQDLLTPFSAALMAATAATGNMPIPVLIEGSTTTVDQSVPPRSAAARAAITMFMRAVVTDGTAKILGADGEVYAKTGTAEFNNDAGEIHAHAWTVGFRGDMAFAALIVGGEDSKRTNAIIDAFLKKLPAP